MFTSLERKKIKKIMQRAPVVIAYLFGSLAQGHARKESDADIAVSIASTLSPQRRFSLRLQLMERISRVLKRTVDVVILEDVAPFFQYVIITEGIPFYCASEIERITTESAIYSRYFDFQPFLMLYNKHYVARRHQ